MKDLRITGLALVAVFAVSGIATGSAAANAIRCAVVVVNNTGQFKTHQKCLKMETDATEREYILVITGGKSIGGVEECAVVAVAGTGTYKDANCTEAEGGGEYIKVIKPTEGGGGGPQFLVGSTPGWLSASVTTTNLGNFELKSSQSGAPLVTCTGLSAPTTITEGSKGLSTSEIDFTSCTASGSGGSGTCDVHNSGLTNSVVVSAKDELVYTGSKEEAEKEEGSLGDYFTPAAGGTTFVTIEFTPVGSGKCPSLAATTKVNGTVIGSVEPAPNTMATEGMLTFPSKAITKGYQWVSTGVVSEVSAGLKAFGTATQIGLADLSLSPSGSWGTLTS